MRATGAISTFSLRSFQMFFFKISFSQAKTQQNTSKLQFQLVSRNPARQELLWSSRVSLTTHQPSTRQCWDCEDRPIFFCFWPFLRFIIQPSFKTFGVIFKRPHKNTMTTEENNEKYRHGYGVFKIKGHIKAFHFVYIYIYISPFPKRSRSQNCPVFGYHQLRLLWTFLNKPTSQDFIYLRW